MYPLLNCIPSTNSITVSCVLLSSTVTIPSNPTASSASAIIFPIVESPFAEIVATFLICSMLSTFTAISNKRALIYSAALSIPLLSSIGS